MPYNQFLKQVREQLEPILDGLQLANPETSIPFQGLDEAFWFKSDIWMSLGGRPFIVELDDDGDCAHSIAKCWPYIDYLWSTGKPALPPAYVGIWRRGKTHSRAYFELAKFIGREMMKRYPGFLCEFREWSNENPQQIARLIRETISSLNIFSLRTQIIE